MKTRLGVAVSLAVAVLVVAPHANAYTFTRGLMQGYVGLDVSALQQLLREQGFYTYPEITGYYGTSTKDAVTAFKRTYGIPPVGGVGPQTRKALNSLFANSFRSDGFARSLDFGSRGDDVSALQQFLQKMGLYTYPEITGYYGEITRAAVASYQRALGIEAVGRVGPITLAALNTGSGEPLSNGTPPAANSPSSLVTTTPSSQLASTTAPVVVPIYPNLAPGNGYTPGFGGGGGATPSTPADLTAPVISSVSSTADGDISVTITWTTDEVADSQIEYGLTPSYGQTTILDTALVASHSASLTGLTASTTYHYRVRSTDAQGNLAVSGDRTLTTFVGLLDAHSNLYAVHAAKRVLTAYGGPLYRLRREADGSQLDINPTADGWPSKTNIQAWLNGSAGFVTTIYDQSGNSRDLIQSTTTKQPQINADGNYPVFDFDGALQEISGTSGLAGFSQNAGAASIVAVRQHDVTTIADRVIPFVGTASGATRMTMGAAGVSGTDGASGRRLDANSIQRTTGFVLNTDWAVEIGRWDWVSAKLYHQRGSESELLSSFQTAGSTSNTTSSVVSVGGSGTGTSLFNGKLSLIAWVQGLLSDSDVSTLTFSLSSMQIASSPSAQILSWGNAKLSGTYAVAPSATNYTVFAPSGATPTESDLNSHRYHHHTRIAVHNGRVWVAFSSSGTNEDASGQMTVVSTSSDSGATWSSPALAVPPQSGWSATGSSYFNGSRVTYPRSFASYNGRLYLISAIDEIGPSGGNDQIGAALVAVECNDDGSLGPLFRTSAATYTPKTGFSAIDYDPALGPPLFALAETYGTWGGSSIGNAASAWTGWMEQDGQTFAEPTTIDLNSSGSSLVRLWRKITGNTAWLWASRSDDSGATWTPLAQTNIPNQPSSAAGLRLSDGHIALVGNPRDVSTIRDPLYIALFDGSSGLAGSVYAVRQGLSATPMYSGAFKVGGAQYPGIAQDNEYLWISYSMQKESIGVTKIPISGI